MIGVRHTDGSLPVGPSSLACRGWVQGSYMSPGWRWLLGERHRLIFQVPECQPQQIRSILEKFFLDQQNKVCALQPLRVWASGGKEPLKDGSTSALPPNSEQPSHQHMVARCQGTHQVKITCTVPALAKGPSHCSQSCPLVSDLLRISGAELLTITPTVRGPFLHRV